MQPFRPGLCEYFGFLFLIYCAVPNEIGVQSASNKFITEYQWSYINFTWPSPEKYQAAINSKRYIPENNMLTGIKFYKEVLYIAIPRLMPGTPFTLTQVSTQTQDKTNLLLTPYPSWSMNAQKNCSTLQNVQSMEIDRSGIMWVLDGTRFKNVTTCPPKLVLLDLNDRGRVIDTYVFRNEICLTDGGFLNDLVLDETDGGYAYITDHSEIDPGLIVYSRQKRRAWKLRDKSMFGESDATNFTVDDYKMTELGSIDGIALSPLPKTEDEERFVFYAALCAKTIYSISTRILKNEALTKTDQWRVDVQLVGRTTSTSDALIIDNEGNLFFGLISEYAIAKWNIYTKRSTARTIDINRKELVWSDSFAMDNKGNLYVLVNGIHKYLSPTHPIPLNDVLKFRIMKLFTGTKNYMFPST